MKWVFGSAFCAVFFSLALISCGKGLCISRSAEQNRIVVQADTKGRFGNWIYQYIFARVYAKRHNLDFESGRWIGNNLFELNDKDISSDFCEQVTGTDEVVASFKKENDLVFKSVQFNDYFQVHTSTYSDEKRFIQSAFEINPEVKAKLQPIVDHLRESGKTLVAIHVRRGDFGPPPFIISPTEWYVTWLTEIWPTLDQPVLFIASDDLDAILPNFAAFSPKSIRNFNINLPDADYFPEYYVLTQADVLAASNSTFSTSSALFNKVAKKFVRPDYANKKMVEFDPWSTHPWESWHK